jgi:hypothetical protein
MSQQENSLMRKFARAPRKYGTASFLMVTMGLMLAATTVLAGAPKDKPLSGPIVVRTTIREIAVQASENSAVEAAIGIAFWKGLRYELP